LSSGVAGTMVAKGGLRNLRVKTVRNIALAWVLTLPVCISGAAFLFYVFKALLVK
jgi:PiT family inorganic phosphate transporter